MGREGETANEQSFSLRQSGRRFPRSLSSGRLKVSHGDKTISRLSYGHTYVPVVPLFFVSAAVYVTRIRKQNKSLRFRERQCSRQNRRNHRNVVLFTRYNLGRGFTYISFKFILSFLHYINLHNESYRP